MTEGEGYLLARLLHAIFKDRPSCAYMAFASIVALVLGAMLFRAQSTDERVFLILGLVFVLAVLLGNAIRAYRQRGYADVPAPDAPSLEAEPGTCVMEQPALETGPASLSAGEGQRAVSPPADRVPKRPQILNLLLLGGIAAGGTVVPVLCLANLAIPSASHEASEVIAYVLWGMACIVVPLAACFGALASAVVTRFARRRDPQAGPVGYTLLAGAGAGLIVGVATAAILVRFLCTSDGICR